MKRFADSYKRGNAGGKYHWYQCSCGTIKELLSQPIKDGLVKSCGCYNISYHTKHGKSYSSEYHTWVSMLQRCMNPKAQSYANYGKRGIKVCKRWTKSFQHFFTDMGIRPLGLTLERINNDGNYTKSNCKWATYKEQNRNRRNTPCL